MTVRAKFKVQSITRQSSSRYVGNDDKGRVVYEPCELQTLKLVPVYDPNPGSENHKFWAATPSGQIELSVVNAEVGNYFELDKEYYVDFSVAQAAPTTQIG